MTRSRTVLLVLLVVGVVAPVRPCTTFCLVDDARIVVGNNYDYYAPYGRVMVNRRGLRKSAFSTNSGLQWVSRFGSLTFNQFGHEFPNGGMNEAGLVVEMMLLLNGGQYPSDSRPSLTEMQWIQYQLDCSASVEEVIASDRLIRIQPDSDNLHFLVSDRTGRSAVIEFLGGQLVCHTGSSLPVAALTNDTYDASLAYAATTSPERADHVSSLGRFVQAAASVRNFTQSPPPDAISYAFSALDNVAQPNWTRWSIVYDIGDGSVYFRTQPAPLLKHIRLDQLDFRPTAPILMMDINSPAFGEVTPQSPYTQADNLAVLTMVYRETVPLANVSASYLQRRAAYPDSVVPTSPPSISAQPVSQPVRAGANATFTVAVDDYPALGYQWQRLPAGSVTWEDLHEGGSYRGTTTATLTITAATAAMSGDEFRCVTTNSAGSATSNAVALTVSGVVLLQYPVGLAVDGAGNLYVADSSDNTIRKITPAGVVSTLAGSAGTAGSQDGTGANARFNQPGGLAVDAAGIVHVADTGNATIRRITPAGVVTTLAGAAASHGSRDGAGSAAWFNSPQGLAMDAAGNLYVADTMNATIRKITPDGTVSTLAGAAGLSGDADGAGSAARFNHPGGIATDSRQLYVADTYNATIRRITLDGVVTTMAGSAGISGGNDGTGIYALFNQPAGVAVDPASDAGFFYVADTGNGTIRRVYPGGAVTTVAGIAGIAGLGDGTGSGALFNQPRGLVVDGNRNLWVVDTGNGAIRKVTPAGVVTTLALTADTTGNTPPPTSGTTPAPVTGTGSASSGGGAMESWFAVVLVVLGLTRWAGRKH